MKSTFIIFTLLTLLASCGSKTGDSNNSSESKPVGISSLSTEENEFKERLLKKRHIAQLELIREISSMSKLNRDTLKKLDQVLEIQCSQTRGLCHITSKE